MKWINIEDRLPNTHESVWGFCYISNDIQIQTQVSLNSDGNWYDWCGEHFPHVTYWMELPELPE